MHKQLTAALLPPCLSTSQASTMEAGKSAAEAVPEQSEVDVAAGAAPVEVEQPKPVQLPPPYTETDDPANGLPCYLCESFVGKSWGSMMNHFKNVHKIPFSELTGTWVHKKGTEEFRAQSRDRYQRKSEDANKVDPASMGNNKQPSAEPVERARLGKTKRPSAEGNKKHQGRPEVVTGATKEPVDVASAGGAGLPTTRVKEDGTTWSLYWVKVSAGGVPIFPVEIEDCTGVPNGMKCPTKDSPPEMTTVAMKFTDEALFWEPGVRLGRNKWPLAVDTDVKLDEFEIYAANLKGHKRVSFSQYVQKLRYFYGLFESQTKFKHEAFLANFYTSGLAQQWAALPIMNPSYSTTRHIVTGLCHLVDCLLIECRRGRNDETARCLSLLRDDVLKPMSRRIAKARNEAKAENQERDASKIAKLPPPDVLKLAIKDAMTDIHWLRQAVVDGEEATPSVRRAANIAMMGIVFLNSYAGRPGEWASLARSKVEECLSSGKGFIRMEDHKTAHVYGTLGRHIPTGNAVAMGKLLDIHPETFERFFAPTRGTSDKVVPSNLLLKFGGVYVPDFQAPCPTLMRKYFHDATRDERNSEKALAMLCAADKHSTKTGKHDYCVSNPAADARASAAVYESLLGEPVPWPTDAEHEEGRARSLDRVRKHFFVADTDAEDNNGDEDDDSCEEADDDDSMDDNPPPVKRMRLVSKHELTADERAYLRSRIVANFGGEFRWPSKDLLVSILHEGMTEGLLSLDISLPMLHGCLRSIERLEKLEDGMFVD
jgi:hypothetical protein